MTEKKFTKRDKFNAIIDLINGKEIPVSSDELIEFCTHEIELLNKKSSSGSGTPTKTQVENAKFKDCIINALATLDKPVTIAELMAKCPEVAELSNQRISAMLSQLRKAEKIVRTYEKKKAYFALA